MRCQAEFIYCKVSGFLRNKYSMFYFTWIRGLHGRFLMSTTISISTLAKTWNMRTTSRPFSSRLNLDQGKLSCTMFKVQNRLKSIPRPWREQCSIFQNEAKLIFIKAQNSFLFSGTIGAWWCSKYCLRYITNLEQRERTAKCPFIRLQQQYENCCQCRWDCRS